MKIGVVGCGHVGSASAYACVLKSVGSEIILIDKNREFAHAQAEDILHAAPFASGIRVSAGDFSDLKNAGIVMIAAGVAQKDPDETRIDLLNRNKALFQNIIPEILKYAPDSILLIASNPVDIMTHISADIAQGYCGHNPQKVIGSGTILDTARFRASIANRLGISSHSVHGYVLGEHGDSEVLGWSGVSIAGMSLEEVSAQLQTPVTQKVRDEIDEDVRRAAYRIIQGKGATWYGIGVGMARIAEAIIEDQHVILTCSAQTEEIEDVNNVTLSLPRIVCAQGVSETIYPTLSDMERQALQKSAEVLKSLYKPLV